MPRLETIELGHGAGADLRLGNLDRSLRELLLPMVTAPMLAEMLGVTTRRLQQLVAEQVLPRADRGLYPLGLCVRCYLAFLQRGGDW